MIDGETQGVLTQLRAYLAHEGRRFLPTIPGGFFAEGTAQAPAPKAVPSPAEAGE